MGMRKPLILRFLIFLAAYAVVLAALIQFQFAKKASFTYRAGELVIQGRYGKRSPGEFSPSNVYPLEGEAGVFFGGMEFRLGEEGAFTLTGPGGVSRARLQSMTLADNGVYFHLAEGPELLFITQYSGGAIELLIRAEFADPGEEEAEEENRSLTLTYRPLPTSRARESGGAFVLNTGGVNYTFNRNTGPNREIRLETQNPSISYRVLPEKQTARPEEFIIPAAQDSAEYEAIFTLWLDQSYLGWTRAASQAPSRENVLDGEMISAYMSEALKRGAYKAAVAAAAAVPEAAPSYEASPYVDRMDTSLRALAAAEREKSARLARLLNEKSPDFFKEYRVIEYLGVRDYGSLLDDTALMLRGFDPAAMTVEQAVSFLEGFLDWEQFRSGRNNPFERFIDQAVFVITENIKKEPRTGYALVFSENEADAELNFRLGSALLRYSDETKIALGRTLILSALSTADVSGAVPAALIVDYGGHFSAKTGGPLLLSSRIYRICRTGEFYARAQSLGAGIWAWTAASPISAIQADPETLRITVNFPAGETHYLFIRGIKAFADFSLGGVSLYQDPQFERYDTSGWTYSTSEQTLLIKLRHRSEAEQITITY
jgi:hypothetical protein